MLTAERLIKALGIVRIAAKEFVEDGLFGPGILARYEQWIKGLPKDRENLAYEIAVMAGKKASGTGADVNGVALDEMSKPSLESLVLYYASIEEVLFPEQAILAIKEKLKIHRGPKYLGPWP